jgi:hydroxymethylpyrimidine/phosphomethylpyrimidine kinase
VSPPIALTIAGSDPSGGAGIQADLKTFSALGVYGCAVITALTAQNTRGVTGVHVVPAAFVTQQLDTLVADVRIDAVKLGMLAGADIVSAVAAFLARHPHLPVVLDPVMVATSGDLLLDPDAVAGMRTLISRADLVTPNLDEAAVLLDTPRADDLATMRQQALALQSIGAARVLVKGGHLDGADAVDVYADETGTTEISSPRVATRNTHGTGCTLSSAIAAGVAAGLPWPGAVRQAKDYLTAALRAADDLSVGTGHGPVHHFNALWTT